MNNKGYFTIQSWMVTSLKLKTVERDMFAIVYGYSQDGESSYYSSIQWASDVTGYSKNSICAALKKLVEKNLIIKEPIENSQRIRYKANLELVNTTIQGTCIAKDTTIQATCTVPDKTIQGTWTINKVNNKNKQNINTNTKVLVENNQFDFGMKDKKPKQSLYSKCMAMIHDYTDDVELEELLTTYLRMRLEIKDKPIYANQWKGLLNKLSKLADNLYDKCKIVQQSIDRGYLSFFEVSKRGSGKSITQREGMKNVRDTHTQEQRDKIREDIKNGKYETI